MATGPVVIVVQDITVVTAVALRLAINVQQEHFRLPQGLGQFHLVNLAQPGSTPGPAIHIAVHAVLVMCPPGEQESARSATPGPKP